MGYEEIVQVLNKKKYLILLIVVFFLGAGVFFAYRAPFIYEATSEVIIKEEKGYKLPLIEQIAYLRSLKAAKALVQKLEEKGAGKYTPSELINLYIARADPRNDIIALVARTEKSELSTMLADTIADIAVDNVYEMVKQQKIDKEKAMGDKVNNAKKLLQDYQLELKLFEKSKGLLDYVKELADKEENLMRWKREMDQIDKEMDYIHAQMAMLRKQVPSYEQRALPLATRESGKSLADRIDNQITSYEIEKVALKRQGDWAAAQELNKKIRNLNNLSKQGLAVSAFSATVNPSVEERDRLTNIKNLQNRLLPLLTRQKLIPQYEARTNQAINALEKDRMYINDLTNKINILKSYYNNSMETLFRAKLEEETLTGLGKVLSYSFPMEPSIMPRLRKNLIIFFVLGMILGVSLAFLVDYLEKKKVFAFPVIPSFPAERKKTLERKPANKKRRI